MRLSDVSVTRPVFAAVLSLVLIAFGLVAYAKLPLRQYPDIDPPVVSIDTIYRGASSTVVESRVTEIIEERIAGIEGIRLVSSASENGRSRITIEFETGRDIDAAANDVRDRVSTVVGALPRESDPPEIQKVDSSADPVIWFGLVSDRMMIPERLTSAAASICGGRAALEIAIRYSDRRVAFGKKIRKFQAVNFMIAEAMTRLDAARGLVYGAAKTVDKGMPHRRLVSEAKKFATEASWSIVNAAMQVLGGIGYTNVYPLERYLRDTRLCLIWTGTSQIMDALIQHETFQEFLGDLSDRRNVEMDAMGMEAEKEKVYTDEDMWKNF